jgi:hypothetical protein
MIVTKLCGKKARPARPGANLTPQCGKQMQDSCYRFDIEYRDEITLTITYDGRTRNIGKAQNRK